MADDVARGGVGLALGAGGLIGHAWHAGVLAALAEAGWDARTADVVVGTSAGSVVAALLRAELHPADVYARAVGEPLSPAGERIVATGLGSGPVRPPAFEPPARGRRAPASPRVALRALNPFNPRLGLLAAGGLPRGATDTAMISDGIGRLHPGAWPTRPLGLCAVRLRDGRLVVFGRDDVPATVGEAVAASCAIPGWFAPVQVAGEDHVDGGVHSPTNVDLLAPLALDVVIASSPMSIARASARRPRADQALRLGHRATLSREVARVRRAGTAVVSFQPGPDDLGAMGPPGTAMRPERREPVARQARETTLRRLETPPVQEALARTLA
jgi:NTE family protein